MNEYSEVKKSDLRAGDPGSENSVNPYGRWIGVSVSVTQNPSSALSSA